MCHSSRNPAETSRPHVCGRDCDYDPDRGCPMAPEGPEPDNDPVLDAIDAELAYLASKIAYLERRDGIR